jgi:hypothetical protein
LRLKSKDTPGKTTIWKPALPMALPGRRGVEVRTKQAAVTRGAGKEGEIRFSPVYAGYSIKLLKKLTFPSQAPAVSDRTGTIRRTG